MTPTGLRSRASSTPSTPSPWGDSPAHPAGERTAGATPRPRRPVPLAAEQTHRAARPGAGDQPGIGGDQAAPDQSATPAAGRAVPTRGGRYALNRQVAAELLGGVGAKVSLAVDGRDGVNKATARGAAYDLILMDLQMPVMDGLEATRQLRTQGRTLPILAMTANASAEDKDECLAAGMDGHLSKPIDLSLVVAAIRQALGKTGQAATQPEGAAPNGFEAALNAQPVDTGWEELADALAAESDSAFDEPQAEAAEPCPMLKRSMRGMRRMSCRLRKA